MALSLSEQQELCYSRAGPLRNIRNEDTIGILLTLCLISSMASSFGLMIGLQKFIETPSSQSTAETLPTGPPCPHCKSQSDALTGEEDVPPPPYSEAQSSSSSSSLPATAAATLAALPPNETKAKSQSSSLPPSPTIREFAFFTFLFLLNILTDVFFPFTVQCIIYCNKTPSKVDGADAHTFNTAVVLWSTYILFLMFSSMGVMAYAMMLDTAFVDGPQFKKVQVSKTNPPRLSKTDPPRRSKMRQLLNLFLLLVAFFLLLLGVLPLVLIFAPVTAAVMLSSVVVRGVVKMVRWYLCGKRSKHREISDVEDLELEASLLPKDTVGEGNERASEEGSSAA